jgi:hypothetical protein
MTSPYDPPNSLVTSEPQRKPLPPLSRIATWGLPSVIVPIAIPIVFDFFYENINSNWTVVTFGCGCPDLAGNYRAFNANHFNMVLWSVVLSVCCGIAVYCARRIGARTIGQSVWFVGIGLSAMICFHKFMMGVWL